MESNESNNDEYSYAIQLYKMGYLKGPKECKCVPLHLLFKMMLKIKLLIVFFVILTINVN